MEGLQGYSDKVLKIFDEKGINVFDEILLRKKDGREYRGILLPRPRFGDPNVLVLKLDNGYNIGVRLDEDDFIKVLRHAGSVVLKPASRPILRRGLPKIPVLGTGGTIASRVDYKTGAVYPFFTTEDIYAMIPEIAEIAEIEAETIFNIFSEDMSPAKWAIIASKVEEKFESGYRGVVIAHGTDTMGYSAAALAFAVQKAPGPVVFVGAQRSSDRPSSDTALNFISAVRTAVEAPFAESVIVMHGSISDKFALVHRGVRARKSHTSRRDAFRSINSPPLAIVDEKGVKMLTNDYKRRQEEVIVRSRFEEKVALIKYYPGMSSEIIDFHVDKGYKGLVLEGTGLGHVGTWLIPSIRRAIEEGIVVVMTSQCIWGRVNMNVYRTGVELLKAGVVPGEDILPETAFAKLSWVLANTSSPEEARKLFEKPLAYEISRTTSFSSYPAVLGNGKGQNRI